MLYCILIGQQILNLLLLTLKPTNLNLSVLTQGKILQPQPLKILSGILGHAHLDSLSLVFGRELIIRISIVVVEQTIKRLSQQEKSAPMPDGK